MLRATRNGNEKSSGGRLADGARRLVSAVHTTFSRLFVRYAAVAIGAPVLIRVLSGPLCGTDVISVPGILLVVALAPLLASPALLAGIVAWRAAHHGIVGESRSAKVGVAAFLLIPLILIVAAHLFDVGANCIDQERKPLLSLVVIPVALVPVFGGYLMYWMRFRTAARERRRAAL